MTTFIFQVLPININSYVYLLLEHANCHWKYIGEENESCCCWKFSRLMLDDVEFCPGLF